MKRLYGMHLIDVYDQEVLDKALKKSADECTKYLNNIYKINLQLNYKITWNWGSWSAAAMHFHEFRIEDGLWVSGTMITADIIHSNPIVPSGAQLTGVSLHEPQ